MLLQSETRGYVCFCVFCFSNKKHKVVLRTKTTPYKWRHVRRGLDVRCLKSLCKWLPPFAVNNMDHYTYQHFNVFHAWQILMYLFNDSVWCSVSAGIPGGLNSSGSPASVLTLTLTARLCELTSTYSLQQRGSQSGIILDSRLFSLVLLKYILLWSFPSFPYFSPNMSLVCSLK